MRGWRGVAQLLSWGQSNLLEVKAEKLLRQGILEW